MVSPIGRHQKKLVIIDLCYTIYLFMDASLLLPIISYSWREGSREFSLADLVFGSHFIVKTSLCWATEMQTSRQRERTTGLEDKDSCPDLHLAHNETAEMTTNIVQGGEGHSFSNSKILMPRGPCAQCRRQRDGDKRSHLKLNCD